MRIRNSPGRAAMHRFYLISPKICSVNACNLAGKLLSFDSVEEVFMTEGKYGYIVKTRHQKAGTGLKNDAFRKHISKLGLSCTEALSHYRYKK
jgi:hypothetical protein